MATFGKYLNMLEIFVKRTDEFSKKNVSLMIKCHVLKAQSDISSYLFFLLSITL